MLTTLPEWQTLETHAATLSDHNLRALFSADPDRAERMHIDAAGWHLDYAKQRVNRETMDLLARLAEAQGWRARVDAMFAGEHINVTEDRPVLHVALRMPVTSSLVVDGVDVVAEVHAVLDKMHAFADAVRNGTWRGHTGRRIRNVVNIGIGGSDLGPAMAYDALRAYASRASARCGSFRTSTAPIWSKRSKTSTRKRRSSSSRRRRSRHSRRSPTRPRRATGCSNASTATKQPWRSTSSRCRPTRRKSPSSGSTPPTCSSSGTGSAAATRCGRRSVCR